MEIEIGITDGWTVLRVTDREPGIAPGVRDRIFDKFYRGRRSHSVPGVDLGLFLARQIAILHGGEMELEAAAPGRCTFRLRMPAVGVEMPCPPGTQHGQLRARKLPGQQAKAAIGVAILKRMIDQARPNSVRPA